MVSGGFSAPDVFTDGKLTVLPWDLKVNEWLHTKRDSANLSSLDLTRRLIGMVTGLTVPQVDKLPLSESNLVLMVARALTYPGSKITYTPVCRYCKHVHQGAFVRIPDELGKAGEKKEGYPGYDVVTLPESQDVVKVRPLLIGDAVMLETRTREERLKISDRQAEICVALVSINDTVPDSKAELVHYVTQILSPGDIEYLSAEMQELSPRLDDRIPHQCDNCGKHFSYSLDLNTDFFRQGVTSRVEG